MAPRWLLLTVLIAATPACATSRLVPLAPPATTITFTSYALGLFPLPGHFTRFAGTLSVDPAHPDDCAFILQIDAASLAMSNPERVRQATGPTLLDAAEYPHILYRGGCASGGAAGTLTLHGITRPLALHTDRAGDTATATGTLRRQDYGITGLRGLLGRTIRIAVTISLPAGLAPP